MGLRILKFRDTPLKVGLKDCVLHLFAYEILGCDLYKAPDPLLWVKSTLFKRNLIGIYYSTLAFNSLMNNRITPIIY